MYCKFQDGAACHAGCFCRAHGGGTLPCDHSAMSLPNSSCKAVTSGAAGTLLLLLPAALILLPAAAADTAAAGVDDDKGPFVTCVPLLPRLRLPSGSNAMPFGLACLGSTAGAAVGEGSAGVRWLESSLVEVQLQGKRRGTYRNALKCQAKQHITCSDVKSTSFRELVQGKAPTWWLWPLTTQPHVARPGVGLASGRHPHQKRLKHL
jgi:hypothetical protein